MSLELLCAVVSSEISNVSGKSSKRINNIILQESWTRDDIALLIRLVDSGVYKLRDGRMNWVGLRNDQFPNRSPNALRNKYNKYTRAK